MLLRQRIAFSVGHVLNDLTAAVWFTYLIAYFQKVLNMGSNWAGYIMLFGQVADALSTTFVGIESDRTRRGGCKNYGRRKAWHLFGTMCVVMSFPFIFMSCLGCEPGATTDWAMFVYYAPFVALFQFGWAAIQISHLALIPELAGDSEDLRVTLAARRNDFTVASTIAVYLLTWLLLGTKDAGDDGPDLDSTDAGAFQKLSLILVGVGVFFTILFHVFVSENKVKNSSNSQTGQGAVNQSASSGNEAPIEDEEEELLTQGSDRYSWFAKPLFYSLAILYTAVRIILNVSQALLPLYVLESLELPTDDIAKVPLALYVAGFFASLITPYLHRWLGRRRVVLLGSALVIAGSLWIFFLKPGTIAAFSVFGVAAISGAGQQVIYIASVTLTSDTIATNAEGRTTAAFVWGVLSFFDKIANGVAIMLIQREHTPGHGDYYKYMMSLVPGGGAIVAVLAVVAMTYFMKLEKRRRQALVPDSSNDRDSLMRDNRRPSNASNVTIQSHLEGPNPGEIMAA